jgi:hypothetical protein
MIMKERLGASLLIARPIRLAVLAISHATCVATKLRDKLHSVIAP